MQLGELQDVVAKLWSNKQAHISPPLPTTGNAKEMESFRPSQGPGFQSPFYMWRWAQLNTAGISHEPAQAHTLSGCKKI